MITERVNETHQMELSVAPITLQEISEDIKKLKSKTAPGDGRINNIVAKALPNRPILYLSSLVKTAMPNYQFGFRLKHSTPEQLHRIVEHILDSFQSKQYTVAAYLDIFL
ncbi:GL15315 [Drosophila persimilis]|uniref:GL15315 n=1 Tax=Drosophila persimilis TaxID=7234 RepID=B4H9C9_DROPE|nr:GL15315 [Drosophila persimilis]